MRWLKHWVDDRDNLDSKLIRRKFGAKGYGIHMALLEIIADNVNTDNYEQWGTVSEQHDTESLAIECGCTIDELNEFFLFVDEKKIYEKKEGVLFYPKMIERLDDYAERIKAKKKKIKKVRTTNNNVGTTKNTKVVSRTIEEEEEEEAEVEEEVKQEEEEKGKIAPKEINSLNLSKGQVMAFIKEFPGLSASQVKEQATKCSSYMAMSSTNYSNPGLFFRGWMKKFYGEWKSEQRKKEYESRKEKEMPVMTSEQIERNRERLQDMKNKIPIKNIPVLGGAN